MIALLVLYPAFYSIHLATLNKSMERFVGFGNFLFLFKRETFWMVVQQSCIFAITAVIFKALIGFIVAHFVHNIPSQGPAQVARHAAGAVGDPAGHELPRLAVAVRSFLQRVQLAPGTCSASVRCRGPATPTGRASRVILVNVWIGAPFFMIMYLAALKSVPEQLYEAAAIDGANWWQRMWYVTLPMMRNIIAITALFSLIVTFANFDIVRILTAGGPIDQHARVRHLGVLARHPGQRHSARRQRLAVHGADPGRRRDLHPARHQSPRERNVMTAASHRHRGRRPRASADTAA